MRKFVCWYIATSDPGKRQGYFSSGSTQYLWVSMWILGYIFGQISVCEKFHSDQLNY